MESEPVKIRIIRRLLELAQPLLAQGVLRVIERRNDVFSLADIRPALWLVTTDDNPLDEDNQGYRAEFVAMFKITIADPRDPYTVADQVEAFIQEAIETDAQLSAADGTGTGLATKVSWVGSSPFTEEINKPSGGTLLNYLIEYRRKRGRPDVAY